MKKSIEQILRNNPNELVGLSELFEELVGIKSLEDKQRLIKIFINSKKSNEQLLKNYIQSVYHPLIVLNLPNEVPPYKKDNYEDYDLAVIQMYKALERVKHLVSGIPGYIENKLKREEIFIRTLEELYKKDAELYSYILLKEINQEKFPGINDSLFMEIYPEWFPADYSEKKLHKETKEDLTS